AVVAYDASLPDDGAGTSADVVQPKDIERFDAATFTWDGGNNYSDNPDVSVERRAGGRWVAFADQSGEVPVALQYPSSDPSGVASYRAGGQVWKWTASFEAFVSRFELVDPQGEAYRATPAGEYRFVVRGRWRKGGADSAYTRISDPFAVRPWSGITVDDARVDSHGRVTFIAGPAHTIDEQQVRRTETRDFGTLKVTLGPVDFPDTAKDQKATGARFLNKVRGYSATSPADLEHYCLDCRFRDWLDATSDLTATVRLADGSVRTVHSTDGHFAVPGTGPADVVIRDPWGDDSGDPVHIAG
ncbi:MAG: hypothetical protein QOF12_1662, partial [Solirubrobacteraceae bacterium]|nr:hypothetical protein [Solirubrobacteraceae bacterium]